MMASPKPTPRRFLGFTLGTTVILWALITFSAFAPGSGS